MSQYVPTSGTKQEQIIAEILDEYGIRYADQYQMGQYIVDFYLPEFNWVLEADGIYGHLKKRDQERDDTLMADHQIDNIIHVKETTKSDILKRLKKELYLEEEYLHQPPLPQEQNEPG